jgi:hypothetical protein
LLEAGITTSEQLLLLPEDVVSVIGDMGQARARILRNYAKRIVLPVLGLRGNYEDPEIAVDPEDGRGLCGSQETGADNVDVLEIGSDDSNSNGGDIENITEDDAWHVL